MKQIIKLGDIEIQKQKFRRHERSIPINKYRY